MSAPVHGERQLARVRSVARLLDSAVGVPGTRFRFGADALLGLIPGVGDVAGAAMSGWVVLTAARLGAPRALLLRMLGNVALDTVAGSVPVLGDLFDAAWRSNTRNVALLERHLAQPSSSASSARRSNMLFGVAVVVVIALVAIAGIALGVWVLRLIMDQFSGA